MASVQINCIDGSLNVQYKIAKFIPECLKILKADSENFSKPELKSIQLFDFTKAEMLEKVLLARKQSEGESNKTENVVASPVTQVVAPQPEIMMLTANDFYYAPKNIHGFADRICVNVPGNVCVIIENYSASDIYQRVLRMIKEKDPALLNFVKETSKDMKIAFLSVNEYLRWAFSKPNSIFSTFPRLVFVDSHYYETQPPINEVTTDLSAISRLEEWMKGIINQIANDKEYIPRHNLKTYSIADFTIDKNGTTLKDILGLTIPSNAIVGVCDLKHNINLGSYKKTMKFLFEKYSDEYEFAEIDVSKYPILSDAMQTFFGWGCTGIIRFNKGHFITWASTMTGATPEQNDKGLFPEK